MKKAKQYAALYNQTPTNETITTIAESFLREIGELQDMRNAQSIQSVNSILDEQDRKWKAFARLADGVKPEGFAMIVKETAPFIWHMWKERVL